MSADVITQQKDNHYSEEIDHLLLQMINEVKDIYKLWRVTPGQVTILFTNEFVPDFVKLYDLTGDLLKLKHPTNTDEDARVKKSVDDLIYFLDGLSGNNGHTEKIDKENIIRGIKMFRDYKMQLQQEGIVVVY
jgi:hypothetical protein